MSLTLSFPYPTPQTAPVEANTMSQGGMLSLEEEIIDATTEEGQAALKQFETQERAAAAGGREPVPDPE
jgi:hypothetical protein